ncbi:hypothetical protein Syun_003694 [Stephania yunnanensis]|uniref:Transposase-associated domain-containing protein n=1 Tax=Stephania yunnanensis TaxID=152371 RepID=A0AAP0L1L3_9MAGN
MILCVSNLLSMTFFNIKLVIGELMDKSWMQLRNIYWPEYIKGIRDFITIARGVLDKASRTRCPCRSCNNRYYEHIDIVEKLLKKNGMDKNYPQWVHHGENYTTMNNDHAFESDSDDEEEVDGVEDLLEYMNVDFPEEANASYFETFESQTFGFLQFREPTIDRATNEESKKFENMFQEAQKSIYSGCEKVSKLDIVIKLFHLKTINLWSNKSFDMLLVLMKDLLPIENTLPKSHYEARTFLRDLGLGYIPIQACVNDCVLFWKANANKCSCPNCGESSYKPVERNKKQIP